MLLEFSTDRLSYNAYFASAGPVQGSWATYVRRYTDAMDIEYTRWPTETLAGELQSWAKSRLEPYKYPRRVTFLEDFPRTHLGKVDRGALARSVEG